MNRRHPFLNSLVHFSVLSLFCMQLSAISMDADAQPPTDKPKRLMKMSGYLQHLQWSPDGKKFLFTRSNFGGKMGLWTVNIDGTELTQLLPKAPVPQFDGHWSPDSKRILFVYDI